MNEVEARLQALSLIREELQRGDKLMEHLERADALARWLIGGRVPEETEAAPHNKKSPTPSTVSFSVALCWLRYGSKVARTAWEGRGIRLMLGLPHDDPSDSAPCIYIEHVRPGMVRWRVRWIPTQGELLGEDWILVEAA